MNAELTSLVTFNPRPILRAEIARAAMKFEGFEYSSCTTLHRDGDGQLQGTCNCAGLLMLTAHRLSLLPRGCDFDLQAVMRAAKCDYRAAMMLILRANFDRIEPASARMGDVLMLCWDDVSRAQTLPHHAALHLGETRGEPFMIQALSREHGGQGRVSRVRVCAQTRARLASAWRLKHLTILENG